MTSREKFASLDLGSNSFRLWVAELDEQGELRPLANHKFPVRLASGVGADGVLNDAAKQRALQAIAYFAGVIRDEQIATVRAVATSTFRVARNVADLLASAESLLGRPVEVVSGHEEARLIYKGACYRMPKDERTRLLVDIGGGSTECIIGTGSRAKLVDSAAVGCVFLSNQYFPGGRVDRAAMNAAIFRAEDHFAPIAGTYRTLGWDVAFGSSGTAKSLTQVAQTHFGSATLTLDVLRQMTDLLVEARHADHLEVEGLKAERRPVLAGGLAVMTAVFEEFGIESLQYCQGALRQGALYDVIERRAGRDIQDASVEMMMRRYAVDTAQAERMAATARDIFEVIADVVPASFIGPDAYASLRSLIHAARLAEIGLVIAHEDFGRHGSYILGQADIPGFSKPEQSVLARLALSQAGSLRPVKDLNPGVHEWTLMLCLRWSSILNRHRLSGRQLVPTMVWSEGRLQAHWPEVWRRENSRTWATLEHEVQYWNSESGGIRVDLAA